MPKPVFLLFFANSNLQLLPDLTRERREIVANFSNSNSECEVVDESETSSASFFDTLLKRNYKDRICVIHFGVHADSANLILRRDDGSSEELTDEQLSKVISTIPGIQLVFLNGCGTYMQVEKLLKAGVGTVIATQGPVNDKKASDLSIAFYTNLANGYSIQESFIQASAEVQIPMMGERIFSSTEEMNRAMSWSGKNANQNSGQEWGLFSIEGNPALKWKLPSKSNIEENPDLKGKSSSKLNRVIKDFTPMRAIAFALLLAVGVGTLYLTETWPFNIVKCGFVQDNPDLSNLLLFPIGKGTPNVMEQVQNTLFSLNLDLDLGWDNRFERKRKSSGYLRTIANKEIPKIGKECNADIAVWGYAINEKRGAINYVCLTLRDNLRRNSDFDLGIVIDEGNFEALDLIPVVKFLIGMKSFNQQDIEKALAYFYEASNDIEKAQKTGEEQGFEQVDFMIASCLRKIGNQLEDKCEKKDARDSFKKAIYYYNRALIKNKEFVEAFHDLGLVQWQLDSIVAAKSNLKEARRLLENKNEPDSMLLAITYNTLAAIYVNESRIDSIDFFAKRSLQFNPNIKYARMNLAIAKAVSGKYIEADSLLKLFLVTYPQDLKGLENQAIVAAELGRHEEAGSIYDRLIEKKPCNSSAFINRANLSLFKLKHIDSAQVDYQKALELDSNLFMAWRGLFLSFWEEKEYSNALSTINATLSLEAMKASHKAELLDLVTNYSISDSLDNIALEWGYKYAKMFPDKYDPYFYLLFIEGKRKNDHGFYESLSRSLKCGLSLEELKEVREMYPISHYWNQKKFQEIVNSLGQSNSNHL
ncbi:MAG: CHAT domain-containing protein [Bacteroidia bacterium]|nr:CHAT domain-containing protein [Bacteroidia bacterium]